MAENPPKKVKAAGAAQTEKRLQIIFGFAVAMVVLGLIAFFALALLDMQK